MNNEFRDKFNKNDFITSKIVQESIDKTLENLDNFKKKKHINYRKILTLASVIFIVFISSTLISSAAGVKIPIFSSLFESLTNDGLLDKSFADYGTVINKEVQIGNTKITLNDVVSDKKNLYVGYTIENNDGKLDHPLIELEIDGKKLTGGGLTSKKISTTKMQYVDSMDIDEINLNKKANIRLQLFDTSNFDNVWEFKFSIDSKDISKNTKKYVYNRNFSIDNNKYKLEKIIISPIATKVIITMTEHDYENSFYKICDESFQKQKEESNEAVIKDDKTMEMLNNNILTIYDNNGNSLFQGFSMNLNDDNKNYTIKLEASPLHEGDVVYIGFNLEKIPKNFLKIA